MATYLVDTSVVIQYFITQPYTPQAKALVERLYQGERLCVPEFCLLECANVLWKQVRFHGVLQTEAEQLIVELLALPFELMPVSSLLPRALQIGLTDQLPVYDCTGWLRLVPT